MNFSFEFLIPRKPKSFQSGKAKRWQEYIKEEALKSTRFSNKDQPLFKEEKLHLTLVWLSKVWNKDKDPDVDNIIKPIQDALQGVVYQDDCCIFDVESHRRITTTDEFDLSRLPRMIEEALQRIAQSETEEADCIYIRVSRAKNLEDYFQ